MATQEHNEQDSAARLELARLANLEISKLAEAATNICDDDNHPIYHGMMARISTLSDIIYYAMRLYGEDEGGEPNIQKLQRAYKGFL